MIKIKKGDIVLVNLEPIRGSEQGGIRPCLIIQNNIFNKYSPVTIIAAITSKQFSKNFPNNVFIKKQESKLDKDSNVLLNQLRTIDKSRIVKRVSTLENYLIKKVDRALKLSLDLN